MPLKILKYKLMKNIRLILLLVFALCINFIFAQSSLKPFLNAVKENNKMLIAAQKQTEALKIEAKTGLTPNNPEFEFGYFPGNTDAIGTKQTIGVSQSFDFPSTYIHKNNIAGKIKNAADLNYQITEQQILLKAVNTWCNSVYLNKQLLSFNKRESDALQLVNFYLKKQQNGDATQLEVNKAKLFLLKIQNQKRLNQSYLDRIQEQLNQLSGGTSFKILDTVYMNVKLSDWETIKTELDSLLPEFKLDAIENQIAGLNLKLNRSDWMPDLMVGYESEVILSDKFSGVKAGISIPLWQNKNKIKLAKAKIAYAQSNTDNIRLEIHGEYYQQFIETKALKNNLTEFKASLDQMNNEFLLARSLELGQISAIEYFMELDYFYGIMDSLQELEFLYQTNLNYLYRYKL